MCNRNDNDNHHNNNCGDHIQSFYQICFQHREVLYSKYTDAYLKNKELFAPALKGAVKLKIRYNFYSVIAPLGVGALILWSIFSTPHSLY